MWQPGVHGKRALKEALDWDLGERQKLMDTVDAIPRPSTGMGRQSNMVYLQAMCVGGWTGGGLGSSLTQQWKNAVPNTGHRVFLRRMMMGAIPHLRANTAKMGKGMTSWSQAEKEAWVQCPCGKGVQDATHFFYECGKTQSIRDSVDGKLCGLVHGKVSLHHQNIWVGMGARARMDHALSWKGFLPARIEGRIRSCLASEWVQGAQEVCAELKEEAAATLKSAVPDDVEDDLSNLMCDCFVQI